MPEEQEKVFRKLNAVLSKRDPDMLRSGISEEVVIVF
jgi:hypothetical protein